MLQRKTLVRPLMKLCFGAVLLVLFLALVVEATGRIRAQDQGSATASALSRVRYLGSVGQFLDYMGQPIATYQAYGPAPRRDLTETGPVSLAFVQEFGVKELMGWRQPGRLDTNPERAENVFLSSGTRCVFYDFVADFGWAGAYVVVTVLVIISQAAFSLARTSGTLVRAAPLVMMLMFWGYSHQLSLLMYNTPKWLFLSFGLWDLAAFLYSGRHRFRAERRHADPA
jgi:hypothetical protein